jgi:hypothetical protein
MLGWYVKPMDGLLYRAVGMCSAEPRCLLRALPQAHSLKHVLLITKLLNKILIISMCIFNFSHRLFILFSFTVNHQ